MKYIEDKDLNFLRNFNSKELDNLVNILTKPLTQELTNREMYKEFYPEHSLYIEEILSELQHFGGNTIANVIRKKGVVYAEILDDVCKALGFKIRNKLSIEEKEELLLKVGKDDGITKNIGRQITSLDTKDTLAFLTYIPAFITKKVSDPAYRITIEAVFEIASLRKQYNLNQENTISQDNKQKNLLLEYSEEIIVKDEESSSNLAEIKVIDNNSLDKINFEEENSIAVGGISHLLSDITKGTISVSNKTIELVFSPEVIEGIKNGNLYIAEGRAWVKNVTTERFAGHAHIVEVGQTAQFLTGGYQLLSIAVADRKSVV